MLSEIFFIIVLIFFMSNAVMLIVAFLLYYAVYGYAECLYDKYITLYVILSVKFAIFSDCFYARCRYAGG